MKIKIRDIPQDGLEFQKKVAANAVGLEDDEVYKFISPLNIGATLEKGDDVIIVKVRVDGEYEFTCARCLETVSRTRSDRFELYFDYTPGLEFIDLGEDVRQEMILELSSVILCRDDCKGLCPGCGANLNKEECRCEKNRANESPVPYVHE